MPPLITYIRLLDLIRDIADMGHKIIAYSIRGIQPSNQHKYDCLLVIIITNNSVYRLHRWWYNRIIKAIIMRRGSYCSRNKYACLLLS